jgi:hypothetical protein
MTYDIIRLGTCVYPNIFYCSQNNDHEGRKVTIKCPPASTSLYGATAQKIFVFKRPNVGDSPELASRLLVGPNIWYGSENREKS